MSTGLFANKGVGQGRAFQKHLRDKREGRTVEHPAKPAPASLEPGTRAECERLTRYITDDGYIAGYLGIDRRYVERIRKQAPRKQQCLGRPRVDTLGSVSTSEETNRRADAEIGSTMLLEAIERALANGAGRVWR